MERVVTGNFEVHIALTAQRVVKITGVIYNDDTARDISERVDMAQDELDRQFIRGDLINKRAQIGQAEESIKRMREHCDGLLQKKNGGRLSSQEKLLLDNFDKTQKAELDKLEGLHAAIIAGEKKLALT